MESSGEKKEYLFKVLVIGDLGVGKTSIIKRYVHQFFSVHYRATISFARFKSTGKFAEHILFNHSPTYVTHLQDTSYWCDILTYVMKVTIVISDERYGFVCLLCKFYTENVSVCLLFLFVFVSVFWHCDIISIALFLVYIFLNCTYIGVDFALKVINWDPDTLIRLQLWDIAGQERFGNMTRVYYKEAVGAFIVFDVTRASTFEAVQKWKNDLDNKVMLPSGAPIPVVLLANKCDQAKEGLVNNATQMDEYCNDRGFLKWFETSAKEDININEAAKYLVSKILENEKANSFGTSDRQEPSIKLTDSASLATSEYRNIPSGEAPKSGCC